MQAKKLARAIAKGLAIYCGLVWLYVALDVHVWPQTLEYHLGLATLFPFREDWVGTIAFAISGIAFIAYEALKDA